MAKFVVDSLCSGWQASFHGSPPSPAPPKHKLKRRQLPALDSEPYIGKAAEGVKAGTLGAGAMLPKAQRVIEEGHQVFFGFLGPGMSFGRLR